MWERFKSWVGSFPWRPATALVGTILLTWAVSGILDWGVEDNDTRDIGIIAVCVAAVVGFFSALIFSPWLRAEPEARLRRPVRGETAAAVAAEGEDRLPLRYELQKWIASWITGEETVMTVEPGVLDDPDGIDYYLPAGQLVERYERVKGLSRLRLAEVALLRRLSVAENQRQDLWRCEAVLRAGGLSDPMSAIARLHDMKLIDNNNNVVILTERGQNLVWLSSQCLQHYPILTAAYRVITPKINKTIRFDGRPLS